MPKRKTINAFYPVLSHSQKQDAPAKRRRVEPRSPLDEAENAANVASREPLLFPKAIQNASHGKYKTDTLPRLENAPAKAESPLQKPKSKPLESRSSPGPRSPPPSPRREPSSSPELLKTRPPTFALLRRRAAAAGPSPRRPSSCPPAPAGSKRTERKKQPLQQLTLDLGQQTTRTCRGCGMSYAPARRDDAALHARFHARAAAEGGGAAPHRLAPRAARALAAGGAVWSAGRGAAPGGVVVCVRRADGRAERRVAEECLRVAERELGALEMKAEDLWGRVELKHGVGWGDAHRVFMYLRGRECVGLLLAERIEKARAAVEEASASSAGNELAPAQPSLAVEGPVLASEEEYPATLGISRIWTAKSARRTGVAQALLEQARRHFLPDNEVVEMDRVAFSQPTQMGAKLARRFFGKRWGWLVYTG